MAPDTVWEIVFLMVILKIPIVYLCLVVYWAIKAEPRPEEGAALLARVEPDDGSGGGWRRRPSRRRRRGPRGGPTRTYARTARAALARAEQRQR